MAADEFAARRARAAAEFAERKVDALLVSFGPNLRYLTGFTGSNGVVLLERGGDAMLFTDPRYTIQAGQEVSCRAAICVGPIQAALVKVLARARIRRLGFESGLMSFAQHEELRAALPLRTSLEAQTGWIEQHRMIKSEDEAARIRRSVETNSQAFAQALRHARAGMREADLAAELDYRMRRLGAEKQAFETIVAAGPRSALPHARPGSDRLQAGGLVVVDMGAFQDGYASDMTRMLHVGPAGRKAKQLYRSVLEAQEAALAAVRPGVTAGYIDRVARGVLKAHGLDRAFVHSTGHGLGLEIHEPPRLGRREKTRLETGMAVTVEPGAYLAGFGGVRIEDTVIVTRTGCDVLTPTAKELVEL